MSNEDLILATRELARRACAVEADLLVYLGAIDERKLYLDRAFPSMFAFCTRELGFSEGAAYNRILVARAARKLPAIVEAVRSGRGTSQPPCGCWRRTSPQRTMPICSGAPRVAARRRSPFSPPRSRRDRRYPRRSASCPRGPPCTSWRLPRRRPGLTHRLSPLPRLCLLSSRSRKTRTSSSSASRANSEEVREAQELLRHRVPDGDLAKILRTALRLLVTEVKKTRFAVGRKPRGTAEESVETDSRHIPDPIKRAVYQRDGGQCTFTDERGKRCEEKGGLEFDHLQGFARTHRHETRLLRLLCHAHNQHAAEQMYGRELMKAARRRTCSGTSSPATDPALPAALRNEGDPPQGRGASRRGWAR